MIDTSGRALLQRASRNFHAGRMAEAIEEYEALLRSWPDLPDSWFNLSIAQRAMGRFDAALASLHQALSCGIEQAEEVHLRRALILAENMALPQDARRALQAALAIAPDYVPALLNLGNLHEDLGERADARRLYARAAEVDRGSALALARAIGVAEAGPDDALLDRARDRLATEELSPDDRADLGFALGAALDRAGSYDAAFAAYAAANIASRAIAIRCRMRYDRGSMEAFVQQVIDLFSGPFAMPEASPNDTAPIFICGMFRSGSTLAERILARHPKIVAGGEIPIIPALIARHLLPYPGAAALADNATIAAFRQRYLESVRHLHPPHTILTDKRPDNVLHIGVIKRLFPDARIVFTVRDALDTCLSVYFLHAAPQLPYATDLSDIAHYSAQIAQLMTHWTRLYPDDIFMLDYDRLVDEPEPTIAALLDFCRLDPGQLSAATHGSGGMVRTASNWQVRQPLYRSSSGRWRNYARHLDAVREEIGR